MREKSPDFETHTTDVLKSQSFAGTLEGLTELDYLDN